MYYAFLLIRCYASVALFVSSIVNRFEHLLCDDRPDTAPPWQAHCSQVEPDELRAVRIELIPDFVLVCKRDNSASFEV
jgi:hypothetical protein